jgi:hypothetical protein
VAFDSSYPTGGEALSAANLGLNAVDALLIEQQSGFSVEWVRSTSKLLARRVPAADGNAAAAQAMAEVDAAVNLSTLTIHVVAFGS